LQTATARVTSEAMKRPLRLASRILTVGAALLVTAAVVCLDRVDSRPYFREPYYVETTARLEIQAKTNAVSQGSLSAGFGLARLTPTVKAPQDLPAEGAFRSLPLAGYGNRHGRPATGSHDDLWVKAVALKVGDRLGVMVGADALIIPTEVADETARRLRAEAGLSREQLYLSATHTHSSLGGWGEGVVGESIAGGFQPGARAWFADRLVAAVKVAVADLKPAQAGQGQFAVPELVRNRLVGELGRVDPEFAFALVKQDGGNLAVLGVYSAHATVQSAENLEFSADYPGCWETAVEQATGGMALFLAGGVGSHSPVAGGSDFASAERMGQSLARQVIGRMPQTSLTNQIAFGLMGLEVTLPPFNARVSDGLRLRPWLAQRLLHRTGPSFLQVFRLEDTVWISTPCDFSGELALDLKDFLLARGRRAVITSFNGDYIGYVVPGRYYHLDSYESRLMSFYGPNVPDYLTELMRRMALTVGLGKPG